MRPVCLLLPDAAQINADTGKHLQSGEADLGSG
jgi:hypothetical protein